MHETAAPIFLHSLPTPDPIHGPQLTGFPGRDDDLEELEAELREVALALVAQRAMYKDALVMPQSLRSLDVEPWPRGAGAGID